MLQSLKDAKRRTIQKMKQSDDDNADPEYTAAVENFKSLESQLKKLSEQLAEAHKATKQWTLRNAAIAKEMEAFFVSDTSSTSLRSTSSAFAESMVRSHEYIQTSAGKVLKERVIDGLTQEVEVRFPELKQRIKAHNATITDLHSYRRRVKNLQDKGKPVTDPEVVKFKSKLERTEGKYGEEHEKLKTSLVKVYEGRHELMRKFFVTIVACQSELQKQLAADMEKVLGDVDTEEVEPIREEIDRLVKSGGPPASPDHQSSYSFKGFFSKKSSPATSSFTKKDPNGATASSSAASFDTGSNGANGTSRSSGSGGFYSGNQQSGQPRSPESDLSEPPTYNRPPPPSVPLTVSPPQQQEYTPFSDSSYGENGAAQAQNPFGDSLPSTPQDTSLERVVALYDYSGIDPGDLALKKGEEILVQEKIDEGWWKGKKADGSSGLFPSNYTSPA